MILCSAAVTCVVMDGRTTQQLEGIMTGDMRMNDFQRTLPLPHNNEAKFREFVMGYIEISINSF